MGRPIKKKWFTAYHGSTEGNLNVAVGTGGSVEAIEGQKHANGYDVASGRVRLADPNEAGYAAVDPDPENGITGTCILQHDNGVDGLRYVRKIAQYRVTYFDDDDGGPNPDDNVWRDGDSQIVGTFVPALSAEDPSEPGNPDFGPESQATATGTTDGDAVDSLTLTDGGGGYTAAPGVTITGDGSGATGSTTIDGNGVVDAIILGSGGTGYTVSPTVTIDAP